MSVTSATESNGPGADRVGELAAVIGERLPGEAGVLVIAGSGLGGFVRSVDATASLPYAQLPHVGASTVAGHSGTLVFGTSNGAPLFLMNGRRHLYEGIAAESATLLLRALLVAKPIRTVILSNAAGGLNRCFEVGDLMLISDQVNWMFRNPLIGRNREDWGARFPDLSDLYSRCLRNLAREAARDAGVVLREGVYLGGLGPSYETRAEVQMLRAVLGADAVGMSTVPEALVAAHMDRQVLGISFISNLLTDPAVTTHEEVMENARLVESKFSRLISTLLPRIG
jgi:purine-nucleoside phosphorylase